MWSQLHDGVVTFGAIKAPLVRVKCWLYIMMCCHYPGKKLFSSTPAVVLLVETKLREFSVLMISASLPAVAKQRAGIRRYHIESSTDHVAM